MRCEVGPRHALRKLFTGLVEQVFYSDVGVCDPRVTEYLSQMLTEFVHMDDVYRLHGVDGEAIRRVSRMRTDADLGPDVSEKERRRLVNRYIGDFTLFWAGVFPEQLNGRRSVERLPQFVAEGKRSYGIAGDLSRGDADPPGALLHQLADQFECCVHGLHLVRAGWEQCASQAKN